MYTVMDFLGDVGGLFDALKGFGFFLMTAYYLLTGDLISHYLVQSVFKFATNKINFSNDTAYVKSLAKRRSLKLNGTLFTCMRTRKKRRMMAIGSNNCAKELEVDRFIRSMKLLKVQMKTLFTRTERFLMKNNREFLL